MKVLYFGHYREGSGWSKVAIDGILALDNIGVDVACRNISLTGKFATVPKRIEELEKKDITNCDYCIQHLLPHRMIGSQNFKKNVGYVELESNFTQKNIWHHYLSLVDEIWVPNNSQKANMESFISKKVTVVPHGSKVEYTPKQTKQDKVFRFYTISDINQRKHIENIIRCYYHSFKARDNVELILKLKKFGINPNELRNVIENVCKKIMQEMRLGPSERYPPISLITHDVTDEEILELHNVCDCYIGVSRGEAWSIPSFEAMAMGNTPICSNEGGPKMFIDAENKSTGTLVNGSYSICNQQDGAFSHIFTGSEFWFSPDDVEVCKAMRYYYENQHEINREDGIKQAKKFDYNTIGNKMKEALNA